MGYFSSRRKSDPLRHTALMQLEGRAGRSRNQTQGFPGGSVVKNPLVNAGDMGLIPALGRSHMSWSNWAGAPRLSLGSRARAPQLPKPAHPRARAPRWEVTARSPGAATGEQTPGSNQRRPESSKEDPAQPKIKHTLWFFRKDTRQTQNTHNFIVWSSKQTQLEENSKGLRKSLQPVAQGQWTSTRRKTTALLPQTEDEDQPRVLRAAKA